MSEMSSQELRNAVMKSVASDPAFLSAVHEDASAAVETRYGKQPCAIRVVRVKDNHFPILIPQQTAELEAAIDRTVDAAPFATALVKRAWEDSAFLEALVTTPDIAIEDWEQRYGQKLPDALEPLVCVERENECCILVPDTVVAQEGVLSEAELETVAGGSAVTWAFRIYSLVSGFGGESEGCCCGCC